MAEGTRSWREVRAARALNEFELEAYGRLMDAQTRVAEHAANLGIEDGRILEALSISGPDQPDVDRREDIHIAALSRFVAALGGQLEVRAVFPDGALVLMRDGRSVEEQSG